MTRFIGIQAIRSNTSSSSFKSYSDRTMVHNDRDLAPAIGIFEHVIQFARMRYDIDVFHRPAFFRKSFTSLCGKGSGILSKDQYFLRHGRFLLASKNWLNKRISTNYSKLWLTVFKKSYQQSSALSTKSN